MSILSQVARRIQPHGRMLITPDQADDIGVENGAYLILGTVKEVHLIKSSGIHLLQMLLGQSIKAVI